MLTIAVGLEQKDKDVEHIFRLKGDWDVYSDSDKSSPLIYLCEISADAEKKEVAAFKKDRILYIKEIDNV